MPSLLSKTLQGVGVTAFASTCGFFVWTKHCHFSSVQEYNPLSEQLFRSKWYRQYNPDRHPGTYDECVRRLALGKIRPELVEDCRAGGSALVEEFCRGVWGGSGYTVQRLFLQRKYRSRETEDQLWDRSQLLESKYEPGTRITDHFVVLEKTPTSILVRGGDSPRVNPDTPRASDGLFEIAARADLEQGFAEFRLKSLFFVGDAATSEREETDPASGWPNRGPMQGTMWYAHQLYTKLWMESAMSRVKR